MFLLQRKNKKDFMKVLRQLTRNRNRYRHKYGHRHTKGHSHTKGHTYKFNR